MFSTIYWTKADAPVMMSDVRNEDVRNISTCCMYTYVKVKFTLTYI